MTPATPGDKNISVNSWYHNIPIFALALMQSSIHEIRIVYNILNENGVPKTQQLLSLFFLEKPFQIISL